MVILTSSPEQRDREMAEALWAKAFRVKPPTGEMVKEVLQELAE
ncbi:MAG: hypothetical protein JWR19_1837 [Pedosphaera sp.]|nr:hypothetical protein [Pedosphaera sp.]